MKKLHLIASAAVATAAAFVSNAAIVQVTADITTNTTWTSDNEYVLTKVVYVNNGALLTIQPGTVIRGEMMSDAATAYDPGTLVVTRFGRIDAQGTASNPIIFTSAATDRNADGIPDGTHQSAGWYGSADQSGPNNANFPVGDGIADYMQGVAFWDANPKTTPRGAFKTNVDGSLASGATSSPYTRLWGGLIVLGNAPTNTDSDHTTVGIQLRAVEGLNPSTTQPGDNLYGGHEVMDNSGILRYVSVRYNGGSLSSANDLNGITFAGVGRGTRVNFIEAFNSGDDGIEIFGGTFDATNLVIFGANDDGLDIDEGYSGNLQYVFIIGGRSTDNLCEWDGFENNVGTANGANTLGLPRSTWSVYNMTAIGYPGAAGNNLGIDRKDDCSASLFNSIVTDTKGVAYKFQNGTTVSGLGTTGPLYDGSASVAGVTLYNIKGNTSSFNPASGSNALTDLVLNTDFVSLTAGSVTGAADVISIVRGDGDASKSASAYLTSTLNRIANPGFKAFSYGNRFFGSNVAAGSEANYINPVALQQDRNGVSSAVSGSTNVVAYPSGGNLQAVTYRGAFPTTKTSNLWTTGWTAVNIGGLVPSTGNN
jgi:hypothetical protein